MSQERVLGKVKWFDNRKGFGFITPLGEDSAVEVFVHHSGLKSLGLNSSESQQQEKGSIFRTLYPGEYVEFNLHFDEKANRNYAINVTGVQGGTLMCENQGTRLTVRRSRPFDSTRPSEESSDGFKTVPARAKKYNGPRSAQKEE